jgi:hypothetical protein
MNFAAAAALNRQEFARLAAAHRGVPFDDL